MRWLSNRSNAEAESWRGTDSYVERFPHQDGGSRAGILGRLFSSRGEILVVGILAGAVTAGVGAFLLGGHGSKAVVVQHCPDGQIEASAEARAGETSARRSSRLRDLVVGDPREVSAVSDRGEESTIPIGEVVVGPTDRILRIPVRGITRDDLYDSYKDARSGGRTHKAIDLMAPRGTDVLAASAGVVEKLYSSRLGGKTIYVRVDTGYIHYYAHLQSYARGLEEGDRIDTGQVIGTVGSTGNASDDAPHLHFAIYRAGDDDGWWQGEPINPFPLLSEAAT